MDVVTLAQSQKHALVAEYARPYRVFVETGLWNGGGASTTLLEIRPAGGLVCYAVDPNEDNVLQAASRGVRAFWGSSADVLPLLLRNLREPACFWLDAHYVVEGDDFLRAHPCPLLQELEAIRSWPYAAASTVLVDDLRLLGAPGWPTHKALADLLLGPWETPRFAKWLWNEKDDILRLTPIRNVAEPIPLAL